MLLKNLDKYIKDKVQGYKPPYQEDLWNGIEKKLPAPRVPNGRGSWLLPVAAVVVAAILVPFTMKFYNITNRNQEMALKNNEAAKPLTAIGADIKTDPIPAARPSMANASRQSGLELKKAQIPNVQKRHFKEHLHLAAKNSPGFQPGTATAHEALEQDMRATAVASNNTSASPLMGHITPDNPLVENNANEEISKKSDARYPDRKNRHPLSNDRWENWQSIYYPFWDNPAYTGSEGALSFTADDKTDNISEPGSPSSQYTYTNIGADCNFSALGLGLGMFRLSDLSKYSLQNTYGLALSKTVLQSGSTSIKIGASGTLINNNLFFPLLNYSDQINPKFGFINATTEKSIEGTTHAFGVNGGLWVSNPHVVAGLDVTDINQPKLGFSSDALSLQRQWRATLGYRFAAGNNFQLMPMMIMTHQIGVSQANAMFTVVYKDKYMLSVAYENIDPVSGLGNAYIYGGVSIAKKIRLFASYGKDIELEQTGINENFVHAGIKWLAVR